MDDNRTVVGRNPADSQWTHRVVEPGLIKGTEVARMASVHACVVRQWVRQGLLTPITLPSGGRRYRLSEVRTLLGLDRTSSTDGGA